MNRVDPLRRRARRFVAQHDFPYKRTLLVEQHLLPSRRLVALANALLPSSEGDPYDLVKLESGITLRVNLRSAAQRAIAYNLSDVKELLLVDQLLRRGNVAVDAGANVGLFTTALARAVGDTGRVHAFEPNPVTAHLLEVNVELNGFENVVVNRLALAAENGAAELRLDDPDEPGLATVKRTEGALIAEVPTRTLDDYALEHGLRSIDFLKLDVEGAELDVLEGARRLLEDRAISRVLFEVLGGSTEVQAMLSGAGYRLDRVVSASEPGLLCPCTATDSFHYANILAVLPEVGR